MAVINTKYNIGDKVWFVKCYEVEKVCEHCGSKYKTSQLIACEGKIIPIALYDCDSGELRYLIKHNPPVPVSPVFGNLFSRKQDNVPERNVYSTKEEAQKAVSDREGGL